MTADIGIDQFSAFLARRAIELNSFDVASGASQARTELHEEVPTNTHSRLNRVIWSIDPN
jgi:hypothetical protein